ncbi:hypothetical protein SAY86_008251 [Trapa natans]|uniref:Laccase n=1 Tax=Trapa natans TaxID=22666 RepID=A0AAN7QAM0_TRANT|nr:hypothetical protein SAY86_008251 [Trapa natans]
MAAAMVQPQRASLFRHGGCWLLLRCLVGAALSLAHVHHYEFVLMETNYTRLCETKSILTVNGEFPGPVIRVHRGDTVFVNVINRGYYGVTLHWHGVKQPRNPWHDGPEYITQCPIAPGTNFTYEVQFTTEEGTLWWHAHSDWTRVTVHGAIVILPPEGTDGGPYPFTKPDAEEVIILASWYKGNLRELLAEALETGSDTPTSDAYTINGQPGDFSACSNVFNLRAQLFTHGSADTTYKVMVEQGKTYLLRIVNAILNPLRGRPQPNHRRLGCLLFEAYHIELHRAESRADHGRPSYSSDGVGIVDYNHSNVTVILEYRGDYTPSGSPPEFPSSTLPTYKENFTALSFRERIRGLATEDHRSNVPREVSTRMFVLVSMGMLICPNSSCRGVYGNRMASSMTNFSWINPTTDILQAYYRNISGVYSTGFPNFPSMYYNFTAEDLPLNVSVPTKGRMVKVLNFNESVEIVF